MRQDQADQSLQEYVLEHHSKDLEVQSYLQDDCTGAQAGVVRDVTRSRGLMEVESGGARR